MSNSDKVFAGSIPDVYDAYLVPLIFESYAADLAARVSGSDPETVLETAAGSGVVPRALAPKLNAEARYVITDLNQPMLDRAIARQAADPRITWKQADALQLPFENESFDAVCCQFGVMFFPDRVAGYKEALRVLRPGGRFLFNFWDRIEDYVTRTNIPSSAESMSVASARGHHMATSPILSHGECDVRRWRRSARRTTARCPTISEPGSAGLLSRLRALRRPRTTP